MYISTSHIDCWFVAFLLLVGRVLELLIVSAGELEFDDELCSFDPHTLLVVCFYCMV